MPADGNETRKAIVKLNDEGTLEGTVTIELNGQRALAYRLENYDEQQDKRESMIKDDVTRHISNAEVTGITIENFSDISKPIIQHYSIKIPNYAQKTGKRMFFQPGLFEYGETPIFASADRKYDVSFRYPWSEDDSVNITFPDTYAVDNGESPGSIADNSKIISDDVSIRLDASKSQLYYVRKFYCGSKGSVFFSVGNYTALKGLFDVIHKNDSQQLSIKQK